MATSNAIVVTAHCALTSALTDDDDVHDSSIALWKFEFTFYNSLGNGSSPPNLSFFSLTLNWLIWGGGIAKSITPTERAKDENAQ